MIDTVPRPDAGLPEFLAARARHASDTLLALDATIGFLVALVALLLRFPGWYIALSISCCFFAFGLWGIADRELGEGAASGSQTMRRLLKGVQAIAAILGALAVATLLMSLLGLALGRIIS